MCCGGRGGGGCPIKSKSVSSQKSLSPHPLHHAHHGHTHPTGNSTYLAEGLRWCDTFVGLQYHSVNSKGEASGYWDTGYKTVYIAARG